VQDLAPSLWRLTFEVSSEDLPFYVHSLEEDGAAVSWFENIPGQDWHIEATIPSRKNEIPPVIEMEQHIKSLFETYNLKPLPFEIALLPNRDWLAENRRHFPPLDIGYFFIYGSHYKDPIPQRKIALQVDAALAFGSGEHATTQGCLEALCLLKQEGKAFAKGLDMGCGSGILAMAIASLWDIKVLACDIDPFSVQTTADNIEKNHLPLITTLLSDGYAGLPPCEKFDIITANILAEPLCTMAPYLAAHLAPQGYAILSGLLVNQAEKVIEAHVKQGLSLYRHHEVSGWSTLILNYK
jgi:ribosomal protein L11 methyltransferase